ncbi:hypothetical protein SVIO_042730 [Streptomyces violaceusniger]|uniref:Uncharacterized protein n=1 Tax=Streptomyces violaceusniger TaxID=68280 RepID=A0A4D4L3V2_STRVO|nr:hypothetical protein SVIO_042730 [Streptomyces violaceusniger]
MDPEAEAARLRAAAAAGKPGAYRAYAELLTGWGRLDEALPWWARAADAGDADASRTLAICHKDRGEFAEAERWYRTAADRDGGCAFGLARLLQEAGDTAGAERWYAHGAALGSVECKTNGAVLLAARGAWDTALERLAEASAEGDDVAAHSRRAIQNMLRDLDGWRAALARAEAEGDPEEAYEALRELLDPERKAMFERYPRMVAEAEALYAGAAAVGSAKALVDQALFIARDDGRWAEARALVERAHERGYDGAAYVLGVWAEENGELRTAEEWYRTADEADGGHMWACFNLGVLCVRQRRLEEAERWLRATGVDGVEAGVDGVEEEGRGPFDGGEERIVAALRDIAAIRADPERMPPPSGRSGCPGCGPAPRMAARTPGSRTPTRWTGCTGFRRPPSGTARRALRAPCSPSGGCCTKAAAPRGCGWCRTTSPRRRRVTPVRRTTSAGSTTRPGNGGPPRSGSAGRPTWGMGAPRGGWAGRRRSAVGIRSTPSDGMCAPRAAVLFRPRSWRGGAWCGGGRVRRRSRC